MPVYRFYIFEKNGHVARPPKTYELPNNAAALEEAKRTIDDRAIEIWRHKFKIGRVDPRPDERVPIRTEMV